MNDKERSAFVAGYEQAKRDAAAVADNEPEPGEWTRAERYAAMAADLKCLVNATVVVTKRNIARDIRALAVPEAPEATDDRTPLICAARGCEGCSVCEPVAKPAPSAQSRYCAECGARAKPAPSAVDTSDEEVREAIDTGDDCQTDALMRVLKPILDALRARVEKAEAERDS